MHILKRLLRSWCKIKFCENKIKAIEAKQNDENMKIAKNFRSFYKSGQYISLEVSV